MKYVEAPVECSPDLSSVFLAGGITDCPDWQWEVVKRLEHTNLTLLNPRRLKFQVGDPKEGRRQIEWEHNHLRRAGAILFWFPKETLCPIALYELGYWVSQYKRLFVGTHPEYQRRFDIVVQLGLARPRIEVMSDLSALCDQVLSWEHTAK